MVAMDDWRGYTAGGRDNDSQRGGPRLAISTGAQTGRKWCWLVGISVAAMGLQ